MVTTKLGSSALVVLRHTQECSRDLWCSRRSSVIDADAGQLYQIVFHASGSAVVLPPIAP